MSSVITIRDVQVFLTQPHRDRLVIVKVLTSEPGLYGLGCATFTQRAFAVATAIDKHIKPLVMGRDVSRIEDIFHTVRVNGYWRNGPVLNNALAGIDQALWDILGKRAGLPVCDLLGGRCRDAVAAYTHADGRSPEEVVERVQAFCDEGYQHVRVQLGGYGGGGQGLRAPDRRPDGAHYDPKEYQRATLGLLSHLRAHLPPQVELLHDVHERLSPADAVQFAKDVEPFRLFFLEDLLPPEQLTWLRRVRATTTTTLALGELFNHPSEWTTVTEERLVDFIRMHITQMGGITPARSAALQAQTYGIRTAWHGPGDTSPVGHAANLHLNLWAQNFGIHEWCGFPDVVHDMFPGLPEVKNGYIYPNDRPGLGIDFDEKLAAKCPAKEYVEEWTQARLVDGSPSTP